LLTLYI